MAITPEELNRYATSVLLGRHDAPNPEILLRVSMSRNYYAAIIKARDFVYLSHETRDTHSKVRKKLRDYEGTAGEMAIAQTIAANLKFMSGWRSLADYRFNSDVAYAEAILNAEKSLETLRLLDLLEERRDEALSEIMPLVFSKSDGIIRFSVHGQASGPSRLARFCPRRVAEPGTGSAD